MRKPKEINCAISRKRFIQASTAIAGALAFSRFSIARPGPSANSKLNIAYIGAGGVAHRAYAGTRGENVVAPVDVDSSRFGTHAERFPEIANAQKFADWFCHIADAPVWALDLYEPTVI